eukprot:gene43184-58493_t
MYSTYAMPFAGQAADEAKPTDRKKVVILGGGPNRIGQGIEFDYCCCHACFALADAGFETIMVNCNPETVSTDYDTSDRLYFEPLTAEDVRTARMVNRPATLDTIVATNLHADILSDLAAALAGSLGIAPTGNIDPERRYPSMFEPIHGSAFDIMGKGLANPIGTFWSVVMPPWPPGRCWAFEEFARRRGDF